MGEIRVCMNSRNFSKIRKEGPHSRNLSTVKFTRLTGIWGVEKGSESSHLDDWVNGGVTDREEMRAVLLCPLPIEFYEVKSRLQPLVNKRKETFSGREGRVQRL